jgi:hypothetical protein
MSAELSILYVREQWDGLSARSMDEALAALPDASPDELGEDRRFPQGGALLVCGTNRHLRPWHRAESNRAEPVLHHVRAVFKGSRGVGG